VKWPPACEGVIPEEEKSPPLEEVIKQRSEDHDLVYSFVLHLGINEQIFTYQRCK
jgi:hypothetical protein